MSVRCALESRCSLSGRCLVPDIGSPARAARHCWHTARGSRKIDLELQKTFTADIAIAVRTVMQQHVKPMRDLTTAALEWDRLERQDIVASQDATKRELGVLVGGFLVMIAGIVLYLMRAEKRASRLLEQAVSARQEADAAWWQLDEAIENINEGFVLMMPRTGWFAATASTARSMHFRRKSWCLHDIRGIAALWRPEGPVSWLCGGSRGLGPGTPRQTPRADRGLRTGPERWPLADDSDRLTNNGARSGSGPTLPISSAISRISRPRGKACVCRPSGWRSWRKRTSVPARCCATRSRASARASCSMMRMTAGSVQFALQELFQRRVTADAPWHAVRRLHAAGLRNRLDAI